MLLDEYAEVPYKVIQFLGAEINYGGRVTDDKDVRLIKTILKVYINKNVNFLKITVFNSSNYYNKGFERWI
jgi:dynein heavy chain